MLRVYLFLFLIATFSGIGYTAYWYYETSEAEKARLRENNVVLQSATETLEKTVAELEDQASNNALMIVDLQEALQKSKDTPPDGVGLSKQSFYLLPKIRQIDEWLRKDSKLQKSIFETHPELSFWAIGEQTAPSKHTTEGKDFRIQLLTQVGIWNESFFDIIEQERKRANIISKDDILDALACLWSAYRCLHGIEQIIGKDEGVCDEEGLLMRYTF